MMITCNNNAEEILCVCLYDDEKCGVLYITTSLLPLSLYLSLYIFALSLGLFSG